MKAILATISITNCFGLAVYSIEHGIDDRMLVGLVGGDKPSRKTWCKVRYRTDGTPYIIKCGRRYNLGDFIQA